MKITFVLPFYPWKPVGGFRSVYEYANHLVGRGHQVSVVHPAKRVEAVLSSRSIVKLLRSKVGELRNAFLRPEIQWQFIDPRVQMVYVPTLAEKHIPSADVIVATAWTTAEVVLTYSSVKGRKYYLIQHYETWDGHQDRLDATWRTPFIKIVIARWLYEKGEELGVPTDEMKQIPYGMDHKVFRIVKPIEHRTPTVAMLYSHLEWKGSEEGVKALQLVKQEIPLLKAVLFGVDRRPEWLPDWIEYVHDPPQDFLVENIYNRASVYVCSSWVEGFGLPPAEAMACGCAVVSTDNLGVREFIEHEKTGLLSAPKNAEALAGNLIRVLQDDGLRIRLARAGHTNIQTFTWERSTVFLEKAFGAVRSFNSVDV